MTFCFPLRLACLALITSTPFAAQAPVQLSYQHATPAQLATIAKDNARHFGDDPETAAHPAADLTPVLTPAAAERAMRLVADWELARSEPYFDRAWAWGVLYSGLIAASDELNEPKYRADMEKMGQRFDWDLRTDLPTASDQGVAQTYTEIYLRKKNPDFIQPTRDDLDDVLDAPYVSKDPARSIPWWWCEALFMAPPTWARLYAVTGDRKYITYLDEQWGKTSALLYDRQEHLYFHDVTYVNKTEANGKKLFWSRANGMVMAGIVRTLQFLPPDDPARQIYLTELRDMAARIAQLQGNDGLWRAGLLDQDHYDLPEVSGSALFTYALAWGINEGVLDARTYRPVVERAWRGMLQHIYADGRLGCIQQTGTEPAPFRPTASYNYGIGAFLLAGSEVHRIARLEAAGASHRRR